jgi:hypothetical protein
MSFALCPDGGPPRIWRYLPSGQLQPFVLSVLDSKHNILYIDEGLFHELPELDRHRVLRTHERILMAYDRVFYTEPQYLRHFA